MNNNLLVLVALGLLVTNGACGVEPTPEPGSEEVWVGIFCDGGNLIDSNELAFGTPLSGSIAEA
jgi:hypothetical protein